MAASVDYFIIYIYELHNGSTCLTATIWFIKILKDYLTYFFFLLEEASSVMMMYVLARWQHWNIYKRKKKKRRNVHCWKYYCRFFVDSLTMKLSFIYDWKIMSKRFFGSFRVPQLRQCSNTFNQLWDQRKFSNALEKAKFRPFV